MDNAGRGIAEESADSGALPTHRKRRRAATRSGFPPGMSLRRSRAAVEEGLAWRLPPGIPARRPRGIPPARSNRCIEGDQIASFDDSVGRLLKPWVGPAEFFKVDESSGC